MNREASPQAGLLRRRSALRPCARALAPALLLGLLMGSSGCSDSGGRSSTVGGGPSPGGPTLLVDFGVRRDLRIGSEGVGDVIFGDLDGDGLQDLVVANFNTLQVSVAFGNPDGSFTTVYTLGTVGHGWALNAGDFDGDGLEDIGVATLEYLGSGQNAVQVFPQGPNPGEFGPSTTYALAGQPQDLVSAPVTGVAGDPGPDELFVGILLGDVTRLELDGGGNLMETGTLDSSSLGTAGSPFSLAVADVGGEGFLDLVVGEVAVSGQPNRVIEYPRDAGGFLAATLVYSPAFQPVVDNAGDVDGNGFVDVGVAQLSADDGLLLTGDGGGLTGVVPIDFGGPTSSLCFPDLDGDGLGDAVGTGFDVDSIQVRMGSIPLVWDEAVNYNAGAAPRAIGSLFLPGDSIPDLLCANASDVALLMGLGGGNLRAARGYATLADGPIAIRAADLDNDGDLDAVTIGSVDKSVSFLEGQDDGTLETVKLTPLNPVQDDNPGSLALGDIDLDGDLDVLVTLLEADELQVYRNDGSVAGFTSPVAGDIYAVGQQPEGLDIADFNGDALPDVVVANNQDGTLQLLLGMGGGELDPQPPIAVPNRPGVVCATDMNNDDNIDVALLTAPFPGATDGFEFVVLSGDGQGNLTLENQYPIGGGSTDMHMGDFDGNGLIDLVAGQTSVFFDDVYIFTNQGDFAFNTLSLPVTPGPSTVTVTDADEDGNLDVIVAATGGEIKIAFGDGNGDFPTIEPPEPGGLPSPDATLSTAYGDLNGDLLDDLLMVTPRAPFVWVALNTSIAIAQ